MHGSRVKIGRGHLPAVMSNGRRSNGTVDLPALFRDLSPSLLWHLAAGSVKPCGLTMRAPDKWESPRLTGFFSGFRFILLSSVLASRPLAGNAPR